MTDWNEIVTGTEPIKTFDPASADDLQVLRTFATFDLPQEYEDFLAFSNGLEVYSDIIWPVQKLLSEVEIFATEDLADLYMPFDSMFVFGNDADGDYFFFPKLKNSIGNSVYVWRHEDDSRIKVHFSLKQFLVKYLSGNYDAWEL